MSSADVAKPSLATGRNRSRSPRAASAKQGAALLGHVGAGAPTRVLAASGSAPPRPATYPDEVLQWPAVVLSEELRREYFEHGCLLLPGFISDAWLQKLNKVVDEFVEKSKTLSKSRDSEKSRTVNPEDSLDKSFVLGEGHSAEKPNIIRLVSPIHLHNTFEEFATGPIADVAQDLLGPDVRLHHSKLNFKMGGTANTKIQWHQDIQFWPHTNYTPLTIGVYLQDVDDDMGPMDVVPLSAYDELHPLEDADGNWTGVLRPEVLKTVPLDRAMRMKGPAGSLSVHNARCVHGGPANTTSRNRLLLLQTFVAATAHPLEAGTNPLHRMSKHGMPMVRGKATNFAVFDPRPCPMAPNFEAGYTPPFFGKDAAEITEEKEKPLMDG